MVVSRQHTFVPSFPMRPRVVSRRHALMAGALGSMGLSLSDLLAAESSRATVEAATRSAKAKSIILVLPWGGPSQLDTLDLKPDAPPEIRSPFKSIATKVAGTQISEHLPKLAQRTDRFAIIRSASHDITTHNSATHYALTGNRPAIINRELVPSSPSDYPSIGSVLARFRPTQHALPPYVMVPCPLIDNNSFTGGQTAGFMGPGYDPFVVAKDPSAKDFSVPGLALPTDMTSQRLDGRRSLLSSLGDERQRAVEVPAIRNLRTHYEHAYDLLTSSGTQQAFDLSKEPAAARERYGMTRFGQSVMMARRLVEAGVRLVLVSDTQENTNGRWDTHGGTPHKEVPKQLIETDRAVAALLDDLQDRGLLDSTIVVWMAEFGRTPKVRDGGGRDHWPHCYSLLMAGGGIRGGVVYGSSDRHAAFPRDNPVSPEAVHGTLYTLLGLPLDLTVADHTGRPVHLCHGQPIEALM